MSRHGRELLAKAYPEVLVVVDVSLFKKFKYKTDLTHEYIVSFFNAVNFCFALLSNPQVQLSIVGIVIGSSHNALPFLRQTSSSLVDANSVLHNMGRYYYKDRPGLPVYDIVVAMTALDLSAVRGGKIDHNVRGYAYVGGACVRNTLLQKINSVAILEDSGGYSAVVTAAHEIAHLLGTVHDGDSAPSYLRGPGATSCPASDGFIMSNKRNTWRGMLWSSCSINQIRHFLKTKTASCLRNYPR